jgi:tetratricopeptide (TPR) repeat protein
MSAAPVNAGLSQEAQLEAAKYREMVLGDLKGAIEQYKSVLEAPKSRAIAAQAWLHMGQCFEKSGRRPEAQAVYTRLIAEFADQAEFSAQARLHLAAWADTLPIPPQLNFALGGPGNVPGGWFWPVLPKESGCPAGLSCTVVLVPAGAPIRVTGDFAQSFSAAPYRGKTVRLRARVRAESDAAQLWLSIDRPKGAGDRIADRPVQPGDGAATNVSAHVDEDATLLNFGVSSMGRGRVSLDDVSLEILPAH